MVQQSPINNNNNNNTSSTVPAPCIANCTNGKATSCGTSSSPLNFHDQHNEEDHDTTSVCSSVSALTEEESEAPQQQAPAQAKPPAAAPKKKKKKSRFAISKAKPVTQAVTSRTNAEAVSISFLSAPKAPSRQNNPKQVIQRALASLRPGGVFFVLDYKEEDPVPAVGTQSPGAQSRAMKEIPPDLLQQWNLTMVPSDLETFYNTKLATKSAKPAPKRTSLPASKRVVRWMGVKPCVRPAPTPAN